MLHTKSVDTEDTGFRWQQSNVSTAWIFLPQEPGMQDIEVKHAGGQFDDSAGSER